MTLHLEGVHICHIIKTMASKNVSLFTFRQKMDENICLNGHTRSQFNMEGPKGAAFCSRVLVWLQGYLGALIFYANMKNVIVTVPRAGTF